MPDLDPTRLVFVDESWASTNMTRTRGRSPGGVRLVMAVPHGHWKTTTFVAGLRTDGVVAPVVVDGPINGELFAAYVSPQIARGRAGVRRRPPPLGTVAPPGATDANARTPHVTTSSSAMRGWDLRRWRPSS